jgi:hypothetical protein
VFRSRQLQRLREQREFHRSEAETAKAEAADLQSLVTRLSIQFHRAHVFGWREVNHLTAHSHRLAEQVDGYQNLLTRHRRLLTACVRYRAENTALRRQHRREIRSKDEQLHLLQSLLTRQHEEEYKEAVAGMTASGLTGELDETPVAAA